LLQSVIDAAPAAKNYSSDAFNTYRELCYWGKHQALHNKSQTYSVEGTNADLRH
jgi:IS1 family transposase